MEKRNILRGMITALVTPMFPDGAIDFDSLTNLVEFQIKYKADALLVMGSTGEAALLTPNERLLVINHVIKTVQKRSKIIVGISEIATDFAVDLTSQLNDIDGIDYYMATVPAYVRPTQDGLYAHFQAISLISKRPIILYNIPGRTGCDLSNKTVLRLAKDFDNIVGLKDATANIARACEMFKQKPSNFAVYSGDDATALAFTLSGGDGVISAVSNVVPGKFNTVISNALAGNSSLAIKANDELQDLHEILFIESNPITAKWALVAIGVIKHDNVRRPLLSLTAKSQQLVKAVLDNLK